ncbi:unnamed protein product [Brassica rapa]|uniref:Uncharacterized protein n=1 Tax=Brassica campestris TaxID=3711 RepID=A0A8D9DJT6_BRACM|nr:unnamed protein product [Brassica rapa]
MTSKGRKSINRTQINRDHQMMLKGVICLEDVILRAAQMEQIVEKVCEERINTGVSKISVNFYEQFHFFNGWKLTDTICFTSKQFTPMRISGKTFEFC